MIFILFFTKGANEEDDNLEEGQIKSPIENGIQDRKIGELNNSGLPSSLDFQERNHIPNDFKKSQNGQPKRFPDIHCAHCVKRRDPERCHRRCCRRRCRRAKDPERCFHRCKSA